MEGDHQGSSPMFLIFLFSIFSLTLIPYTLYRLCGGGADNSEGVVKTWADKKKKKQFGDRIKGTLGAIGWKLLVAWALYILLFWCAARPGGALAADHWLVLALGERSSPCISFA